MTFEASLLFLWFSKVWKPWWWTTPVIYLYLYQASQLEPKTNVNMFQMRLFGWEKSFWWEKHSAEILIWLFLACNCIQPFRRPSKLSSIPRKKSSKISPGKKPLTCFPLNRKMLILGNNFSEDCQRKTFNKLLFLLIWCWMLFCLFGRVEPQWHTETSRLF